MREWCVGEPKTGTEGTETCWLIRPRLYNVAADPPLTS